MRSERQDKYGICIRPSSCNTKMLARDFYSKVICSEEECLSFLRKHNALAGNGVKCNKCNHSAPMVEQKRKQRSGRTTVTWRCENRNCKSIRSVRDWNALFYHEDEAGKSNSRLTLCAIMEIVHNFLYNRRRLQDKVVRLGHSKKTLSDWLEYCRATKRKAMELDHL